MLRDFMNHGSKLLGFVYQALTECKVTTIQPLSHGFCINLSIHSLEHLRNMKSRNQYMLAFLNSLSSKLSVYISLQVAHSIQNPSHLSLLPHSSFLVLYLFLLELIACLVVLVNLGL
jgi:hypothetical protein